MGVFDDKQVAAAIARLTTMPSKGVENLLKLARTRKIVDLAEACEAELATRPFEFAGDDAVRFDQMAKVVGTMPLVDAIRYAFSDVREATKEERIIIPWIARNPGTSYDETLAHYGNGDLGLVIGHLAYFRYGCFRRFMDPKQDQSSVLLIKDRSGRSVRYWLRPEAALAFKQLELI